MTHNENRIVIIAALIVGICFLMGIAIGGYFIGKGGTRFNRIRGPSR